MPSRRQIYRRRRIVVFGGLLLVLALAFYLPMTLLAPLRAAEASVLVQDEPPGAAADLRFPGYGASAIGALDFPGVLASAGSDKPLPMASITKIVMALVTLEKHPLAVDDGELVAEIAHHGLRHRAADDRHSLLPSLRRIASFGVRPCFRKLIAKRPRRKAYCGRARSAVDRTRHAVPPGLDPGSEASPSP